MKSVFRLIATATPAAFHFAWGGGANTARTNKWLSEAVLALVMLSGLGASGAVAAGTWTATGPLLTSRGSHVSAVLQDGKVLVAGGLHLTASGFVPVSSAEIYAPAAGSWTSVGSLNQNRAEATSILLQDGRVLVVGGLTTEGVNGVLLNSAEIYSPSTQTWTMAAAMATARYRMPATLLQNGKVLVAGGYYTANAEIFDPATGTWTATGPLTVPRYQHTATLLPDGKVLVVGGENTEGSAEIYDPATGVWTATTTPLVGRNHSTATLLASGKVLLVGGAGSISVASAELYDPVTASWSAAGSLVQRRSEHTATKLANGKVLIAGGYDNGPRVGLAEIYDPATGQWSEAGSSVPRYGHSAGLLQDGNVLVSGGYGGSIDDGTLTSVQVYSDVDSTPPQISLIVPYDGARFPLRSEVRASYSCSDNVAIASCVGTLPNGALIDTRMPGDRTFKVTATDTSGLTTTRTVTYTVQPANKPPRPR